MSNGTTIQCLVTKFSKTGSVADAHKGWHRSSFGIIPENIQNLPEHHEESHRKSTWHLSQETGISRTSVLRIFHDDLKLFRYKSQTLQRQTDQNEAEWETFCEDISQRIENDPGLFDLTTVAFLGHLLHFLSPENWPPNVELSFYEVHCSCQNLSCISAMSEELVLWQNMLRWFLSAAA